MMKRCYTEINLPFGWDREKRSIAIKAFEPLKVIDDNGLFCLVKKMGRGQRRVFLVAKANLIFEN